MQVGFYDWDWWTGSFAHYGFTAKTEPEEVVAANFYVGGPGEYYSTLLLATYRHGKGRLILSELPMDWNSPAGLRLRVNVLKACGAKADGPADTRAWAKDCGVRLPNARPDATHGYRPRALAAGGMLDPDSVEVIPTYYEHSFDRGTHWQLDPRSGTIGFIAPAYSNEIVDVVYRFRTTTGCTACRLDVKH